ncbi:MAG: 4-hydroxythreonine-4-phosphate dehydrogenase PdxA [Planctomycetota bacterium]
MTRPKLAITIGEASGVGPELALRVCEDPLVRSQCIPLLCGDHRLLTRVGKMLSLNVPPPTDSFAVNDVATIQCGDVDVAALVPGQFSANTGRASYETVCTAADAAVRGDVDAMVTGPIQKEAWSAAGIPFPGHTELLADRAGRAVDGKPADVRMMLTSTSISCVLETIHMPLADVPRHLNQASLVRTINLAAEAIERRLRSGGSRLPPQIAVLGLNPHAGESGMFSHGEEDQIVIPAIETARQSGRDVIGPLPPDTAFTPAMRSRVDAYVCLYHDQGLIPLKALAFDDAVNVTLGLPIVRTSVDHGTAMDLAWQGKASHSSLIAAIDMAVSMVRR